MEKIRAFALALLLAFAHNLAVAEAETYGIDPEHSFANWTIRHVVARTSGTFSGVKGKVVLDRENMARSTVDAVISLYELNSSHRKRDIHLLTEDFLDAHTYPEMKFVSTRVESAGPDKGVVTGFLTLHGVSREVRMDYRLLGVGPDPWGGQRAGFEADLRINRSDFGISRYTELPGGGPVGNEVEIKLLVEGIRLGPDGQPWKSQPAAEKPAPAATPAAAKESEPKKEESIQEQLERKLKGLLK
jgi:polyisoprenoid-binding protein YceI